jgi:hypothetical protein
MRCPDCNKFVSMEFSEPDVSDIQVSEDGEVTASVTLTRTCVDCGSDLKTAELELTCDMGKECEDHVNAEGQDIHDLTVEQDDVNQIEEGGGRYAKSYFGAEVCFTITCKCDRKFEVDGAMSDKVAASEMEECC